MYSSTSNISKHLKRNKDGRGERLGWDPARTPQHGVLTDISEPNGFRKAVTFTCPVRTAKFPSLVHSGRFQAGKSQKQESRSLVGNRARILVQSLPKTNRYDYS